MKRNDDLRYVTNFLTIMLKKIIVKPTLKIHVHIISVSSNLNHSDNSITTFIIRMASGSFYGSKNGVDHNTKITSINNYTCPAMSKHTDFL